VRGGVEHNATTRTYRLISGQSPKSAPKFTAETGCRIADRAAKPSPTGKAAAQSLCPHEAENPATAAVSLKDQSGMAGGTRRERTARTEAAALSSALSLPRGRPAWLHALLNSETGLCRQWHRLQLEPFPGLVGTSYHGSGAIHSTCHLSNDGFGCPPVDFFDHTGTVEIDGRNHSSCSRTDGTTRSLNVSPKRSGRPWSPRSRHLGQMEPGCTSSRRPRGRVRWLACRNCG